MLSDLEKIKKKPEHIRKRILYISVFSIMALILFIWMHALENRLHSVKEKSKKENSLSPFSAIGSFAKETFKKKPSLEVKEN